MENQNIRIRLRGYDNSLLDTSTQDIINTAKDRCKSERPYPTSHKIWRFTVNKSPHIDKSRDQLEIRTHNRLLDIIDPTPQTVDVNEAWLVCRCRDEYKNLKYYLIATKMVIVHSIMKMERIHM